MTNKVSSHVPGWLGEIVKRHIERLKLLRLEGEPLAEAMGEVTRIWGETLAEYYNWDRARDTPRLHQGFAILTATSERWPAPAHLLMGPACYPARTLPAAPAPGDERSKETRKPPPHGGALWQPSKEVPAQVPTQAQNPRAGADGGRGRSAARRTPAIPGKQKEGV